MRKKKMSGEFQIGTRSIRSDTVGVSMESLVELTQLSDVPVNCRDSFFAKRKQRNIQFNDL
jgi:hypothetical protein